MNILQAFHSYWNIPDPVRLDKVEDVPSNSEALFFGLKISVLATAIFLVGSFVGLFL